MREWPPWQQTANWVYDDVQNPSPPGPTLGQAKVAPNAQCPTIVTFDTHTICFLSDDAVSDMIQFFLINIFKTWVKVSANKDFCLHARLRFFADVALLLISVNQSSASSSSCQGWKFVCHVSLIWFYIDQ